MKKNYNDWLLIVKALQKMRSISIKYLDKDVDHSVYKEIAEQGLDSAKSIAIDNNYPKHQADYYDPDIK